MALMVTRSDSSRSRLIRGSSGATFVFNHDAGQGSKSVAPRHCCRMIRREQIRPTRDGPVSRVGQTVLPQGLPAEREPETGRGDRCQDRQQHQRCPPIPARQVESQRPILQPENKIPPVRAPNRTLTDCQSASPQG